MLDATALISTKDELAARLGFTAPSSQNIARLKFSTILSTSRSTATDAVRNSDPVTKAKEAIENERPVFDSKKPARPQRSIISQLETVTQSVTQPIADTGEAVSKQFLQDKGQSQSQTPSAPRKVVENAKDDVGQAVSSALGLANDTPGEVAASLVTGALLQNLPADGTELSASQLLANAKAAAAGATDAARAAPQAAANANPQGVALGGVVDDSTLPNLIAPLTNPQGDETGLARAQTAASNQTAVGHRAEAASNALLGALVNNTTARGQKNLVANANAAGDEPRATLPGNAQNTPAANKAQAFQHAPVFAAAQAAAQDEVLPQTEAVLPVTPVVTPKNEGEARVRATLLPSDLASLLGKPLAQNGAQPGQANGNTGNSVTPGPNTLPDANATLPAQSNADLSAASAQAALASRSAAEQARVSFDGSAKVAGDPLLQNVGATSETGTVTGDAAARAAAARGTRAPMHQAPVAEQVAVRISKAIANGTDKIEISLKPASMGTVRVALEVGHDGRVMAVISADRAETLDMLKQDSRSLERALQDAGLKTDSNSLNFNLRGGGDNNADKSDTGGTFGSGGDGTGDNDGQAANNAAQYFRANSLLDIHV